MKQKWLAAALWCLVKGANSTTWWRSGKLQNLPKDRFPLLGSRVISSNIPNTSAEEILTFILLVGKARLKQCR